MRTRVKKRPYTEHERGTAYRASYGPGSSLSPIISPLGNPLVYVKSKKRPRSTSGTMAENELLLRKKTREKKMKNKKEGQISFRIFPAFSVTRSSTLLQIRLLEALLPLLACVYVARAYVQRRRVPRTVVPLPLPVAELRILVSGFWRGKRFSRNFT